MPQQWNDPGRRVAVLQDELRRLRARAERWGAAATAAALSEALERSAQDLPAAAPVAVPIRSAHPRREA